MAIVLYRIRETKEDGKKVEQSFPVCEVPEIELQFVETLEKIGKVLREVPQKVRYEFKNVSKQDKHIIDANLVLQGEKPLKFLTLEEVLEETKALRDFTIKQIQNEIEARNQYFEELEGEY